MTKNMMVQNAAGELIGSTYEKRAKGLLKSGRAVWVNDHTIQLRSSVQNAATPKIQKEQNMPDQILFCADLFHAISESDQQTCSCLTVMKSNETMEVWELCGTCGSAAIATKLQAKPNEEYLFQFATVGGVMDGTLRFTYKTEDAEQTFALEKNRYRPFCSRKTSDEELLQVYQLPIKTGKTGIVSIQIQAKHVDVQILPVQDATDYAIMQPYYYADWKKDMVEAAKAAKQKKIIDLSNAKLPKSVLMQILENCEEADEINLKNADIYNDME